MSDHLASAVASRIVLFYNLSPQHTSSPEFGQFHKIVGRYTKVEFYPVGYFVNGQTLLGESGQPLVTPGQSKAQFLGDERACVVQHHGIDSQHSEPR